GLISNLARPGGNITGNTVLGPALGSKRLQLLKEAIPSLSRVGFLWNPDNASHPAQLTDLKAVADVMGLKIILASARSSDELTDALTAMARDHPEAFVMTNDPTASAQYSDHRCIPRQQSVAGDVPDPGDRNGGRAVVLRCELARFIPARG